MVPMRNQMNGHMQGPMVPMMQNPQMPPAMQGEHCLLPGLLLELACPVTKSLVASLLPAEAIAITIFAI